MTQKLYGRMTEPIEGEVIEYPEVSKTGKRFRYVEPGIREYESGAMYDESKGRGGLIRPADSALITADKASEYGVRSLEAKKARALEGMRRSIEKNRQISVPVEKVGEYWGEAVMDIALEHGSKNQVAALRLAAEGPLELLGKRSEGELPPGSVRLSLTGSVADLRNALTRPRDGSVTPTDGGEGGE